MKRSFNNPPLLLNVAGKRYLCELDMKMLDLLEVYTDKGLYEIYDAICFSLPQSMDFLIDLVFVAAIKHNGIEEAAKLRKKLCKKPEISMKEFAKMKVYFKMLFPDKDFFENNKITTKKPAKYFDFMESYACAKNLLRWSEDEFWSSDPKKLAFALVAQKNFNEAVAEMKEERSRKNSIDLLKTLKAVL